MYPRNKQSDALKYHDHGSKCIKCGYDTPLRWAKFDDSCQACVVKPYRDNMSPHHRVRYKPCGKGPHLRITANGSTSKSSCLVCRDLATVRNGKRLEPLPIPLVPDTHETALAAGHEWFAPDFRCSKCNTIAVRHTTDPDRCQGCDSMLPMTPKQVSQANRKAARENNEPTYMPGAPCPSCNTLSPRRTTSTHCTGCKVTTPSRPPSLRQKAIVAGLKWYTPDKPCKYCNVVAPKRVNDSSCSFCLKATDADRLFVQVNHPITQDQAVTAGLNVYHDGTNWYWGVDSIV